MGKALRSKSRFPRSAMLRALSGESESSHYALQIGSFCTLVAVQSTALLLFKVCQVAGTYTFSPASNVALTEMCKLGLAILYTVNNQLTFLCFELADPGSY